MGFRGSITRLADIPDARQLANAAGRNAPIWDAVQERWEPTLVASAAIAVVDEAETFVEADVTITHDGTAVEAGAVVLASAEWTGTLATITAAYTGITGRTANSGARFVPSKQLGGIRVTKDTNSTATHAHLYDVTGGGALLATQPFDGHVAEFGGILLASGNVYAVTCDALGATYTRAEAGGSPAYPFTSADLSITHGATSPTGSTTSGAYNVKSIESADPGATAGAPIVEWPAPSDVGSWDVAAVTVTPGDGTIVADVVDTDGTVHLVDIDTSSPVDVSAVPVDKNLALRFTMTRPGSFDTSPSVEWCARRYSR